MTPRSGRLLGLSVLVVATLAGVGACGGSAASTSAAVGGSGGPVATAHTPGPTPSLEADQTDTDWGRVWDRLPKGFPVYTGAVRSDETDQGPASAVFVIQGASATDVISWYDTRLEAAGYRIDALTGPTEDGGFTLDTTGRTTDCRLEVRVAPLGPASSFLAIAVNYGAGCPKP